MLQKVKKENRLDGEEWIIMHSGKSCARPRCCVLVCISQGQSGRIQNLALIEISATFATHNHTNTDSTTQYIYLLGGEGNRKTGRLAVDQFWAEVEDEIHN